VPRLLLLLPTTTYRAEAFLDAARKLDLDVTVGSETEADPPPSAGFLPLNFRNLQNARRTVLAFTVKYPIAAVVGVDDNSALIAAGLAETLGLTATIRAIPIVEPEAVHGIGLVVPDREPMPPLSAALVAEAKLLAVTLS